MATLDKVDTRFAPASLRVFLAALAIIDNLRAVLIIPIFYTTDLPLLWFSRTAGLVLNNGQTATDPLSVILRFRSGSR
ncbi:Na+/H+ antiporter NhaA [Sphingomonas sanxanigenens]|uniref:Putative Na(+)/H(+) antiporter NhaA homolog n=1 Tax=Sphingomonas sanxanigenens DSM 19645 = NX02 TaxID=1123269 RepID=W0AIG6_9SPHN|nr:Na+/H+ antiporter NhaA [Sphingomonas sanxanigenens]AHE55450.1 hypothetical protein NX02_18930 [Sphingomonas sanxanigenens DSM 19645 = NX02]